MLQEIHEKEKGRKEHVNTNLPVGSIFKIKPTALINTPVPWVDIKPVENDTKNSMIRVSTDEDLLGPWSSSDEEMSEDEKKPAAKEAAS